MNINHYKYIGGKLFPVYSSEQADTSKAIYYGALSRYHYEKINIVLDSPTLFLTDTKWHKTIGSYKFVDNGNGTYDSFQVDEGGIDYSLKVNKPFETEDLTNEIKDGYLKLIGTLNKK